MEIYTLVFETPFGESASFVVSAEFGEWIVKQWEAGEDSVMAGAYRLEEVYSSSGGCPGVSFGG